MFFWLAYCGGLTSVVDVTLRPEGSSALRQDTLPRPKWTLGLWRTTFLAPSHSYFWQKWKCMHYRHNEFQNFLQNLALDAHDALHRKSTLAFIRHCSRVGGRDDKLAIDKGGNLPEKVENHCCRPSKQWCHQWRLLVLHNQVRPEAHAVVCYLFAAFIDFSPRFWKSSKIKLCAQFALWFFLILFKTDKPDVLSLMFLECHCQYPWGRGKWISIQILMSVIILQCAK